MLTSWPLSLTNLLVLDSRIGRVRKHKKKIEHHVANSYLLSERKESGGLLEGLNLSNFECSMASVTEIRDFRYGFRVVV